MAFQQARQFSLQKTQTQQNASRFAPRPLTVQAQQDADRLPTQVADSEAPSLEQAARFGHAFGNIPVFPPDTQTSAPVQAKQTTGDEPADPTEQRPNQTGLPDHLKAGIEHLSGFSLDKVKVYYNSDKPAQLNALAYAQGTDIHVAPGQERHLPHEVWHVVQQAQGRVRPTMQLKDGVSVNDDQALEHEADVIGTNAIHAFEFPIHETQATGKPAYQLKKARQATNDSPPGRAANVKSGIGTALQFNNGKKGKKGGNKPGPSRDQINEFNNQGWLFLLHMFLQHLQETYPQNDPTPLSGDVARKDELMHPPTSSVKGSDHHTDTKGSGKQGRKVASKQLISDVEGKIADILRLLNLKDVPEYCRSVEKWDDWRKDHDPSGGGGLAV